MTASRIAHLLPFEIATKWGVNHRARLLLLLACMRSAFVGPALLLALVSATAARAADTPAPGLGSVPSRVVRIDFAPSDPTAQLVGTRYVPVGMHWERGPVAGGFTLAEIVCNGPCSKPVDPEWAFHVGGPGLTPSKQFLLPVGSGPVELRASTGGSTARGFGGFFTFSGLTLAGLGAGCVGVHLLGRPIDADSTLRTTGFALLGSAVFFLSIGLPLYLANGTSVTTTPKPLALTPRGIVF